MLVWTSVPHNLAFTSSALYPANCGSINLGSTSSNSVYLLYYFLASQYDRLQVSGNFCSLKLITVASFGWLALAAPEPAITS